MFLGAQKPFLGSRIARRGNERGETRLSHRLRVIAAFASTRAPAFAAAEGAKAPADLGRRSGLSAEAAAAAVAEVADGAARRAGTNGANGANGGETGRDCRRRLAEPSCRDCLSHRCARCQPAVTSGDCCRILLRTIIGLSTAGRASPPSLSARRLLFSSERSSADASHGR